MAHEQHCACGTLLCPLLLKTPDQCKSTSTNRTFESNHKSCNTSCNEQNPKNVKARSHKKHKIYIHISAPALFGPRKLNIVSTPALTPCMSFSLRPIPHIIRRIYRHQVGCTNCTNRVWISTLLNPLITRDLCLLLYPHANVPDVCFCHPTNLLQH